MESGRKKEMWIYWKKTSNNRSFFQYDIDPKHKSLLVKNYLHKALTDPTENLCGELNIRVHARPPKIKSGGAWEICREELAGIAQEMYVRLSENCNSKRQQAVLYKKGYINDVLIILTLVVFGFWKVNLFLCAKWNNAWIQNTN